MHARLALVLLSVCPSLILQAGTVTALVRCGSDFVSSTSYTSASASCAQNPGGSAGASAVPNDASASANSGYNQFAGPFFHASATFTADYVLTFLGSTGMGFYTPRLGVTANIIGFGQSASAIAIFGPSRRCKFGDSDCGFQSFGPVSFIYGDPIFIHEELLASASGNGPLGGAITSASATMSGIDIFSPRNLGGGVIFPDGPPPDGAFYTLVETPEPGTLPLFGGLACLAAFHRLRRSHLPAGNDR